MSHGAKFGCPWSKPMRPGEGPDWSTRTSAFLTWKLLGWQTTLFVFSGKSSTIPILQDDLKSCCLHVYLYTQCLWDSAPSPNMRNGSTCDGSFSWKSVWVCSKFVFVFSHLEDGMILVPLGFPLMMPAFFQLLGCECSPLSWPKNGMGSLVYLQHGRSIARSLYMIYDVFIPIDFESWRNNAVRQFNLSIPSSTSQSGHEVTRLKPIESTHNFMGK